MANIFNADDGAISGSAGIKLSSDTSGVLNIQTNGVTAISIAANQVVSFPATVGINFNGQIQFEAGTALIPAISTVADTNTGIYFPGADQIAISTGGVQRFFVGATGDVGIGTGSPSQLVEAVKSLDADVVYQITNANSGPAATAQFFASNGTTKTQFFHTGTNYAGTGVLNAAGLGGIYNVTAAGISLAAANAAGTIKFATGGTTERMRLDSSGNLGLGVTPSAWGSSRRAIQIGGNTVSSISLGAAVGENLYNCYTGSANFVYTTNGPAASFDFNNATSGGFAWRLAASGTAGNTITFTQAMTLDASGNLTLGLTSSSGLATSTPTYITLGALFSDTVGTASKAKLKLFEATGFIYGFGISSNLLENHVPSNASVAWFINNSERMRLNTSGYLTVPNQPMFAAEHSATETPNTGDPFLSWNVNVNTVTAAWNASTGVYTVPVAGRYFVACSLLRNTGSGSGGVYLQQNGTNVIRLFYCDSGAADSGYAMGSGQTIVSCSANDTLRVIQETSGVSWYGDGTGLGNFTIYLIG